MNDFLRNLRSSQKKDGVSQRKNTESHFHPHRDRRKIPDRRANYSGPLESIYQDISDLLPELVTNACTLLASKIEEQEQDQKIAAARLRQYESVSTFFETLSQIAKGAENFQIPGDRPKATTGYASGTHYTKDDILSIIQTMRDNGSTFAIIAEYLKDKGIPTFSGRGEWHAQTIHRLCR